MRVRELGSAVEWSASTSCIIASLAAAVLTLGYAFLGSYLLRHEELAPYLDRDFLAAVGLPFGYMYSGLNACIAVVSLALYRRRPDCRPLVYATVLIICIGSGLVVSWMFGQFTNPLPAALFLTIASIGLVLFDRRPMAVGLGACLVGLVLLSTAQQMGAVRYAPLFSGSPVRDGHLSSLYLAGPGAATSLLVLAVALLFANLIARWREREAEIKSTSEQLSRANDVISRYVAHQLVERVRNGDYEIAERYERRKLTLFFSDIESFTAIAERMEPEDLAELLNQYLSEMTAIGERYGATIDKFVGDAIMMFFGAPTATNDRDHALRAVRMAIEMQRRLAALRQSWLSSGVEHPFVIRIGINTGQASVGNFGSQTRMDYTAIGRQVNLAARLQARCDPGGILISHSTYVLIGNEIPCLAQGKIEVRGFEHPVRVYSVLLEDAGDAVATR